MNNKGFTLAELLAIVVIIGVIAVISTINITNQISSSDNEEKNVLSQNIENASKVYAAKYYAKDLVEGNTAEFTLDDLVKDGLINLKEGQCEGYRSNKIYFLSEGNYENITSDNCYKTSDDE